MGLALHNLLQSANGLILGFGWHRQLAEYHILLGAVCLDIGCYDERHYGHTPILYHKAKELLHAGAVALAARHMKQPILLVGTEQGVTEGNLETRHLEE